MIFLVVNDVYIIKTSLDDFFVAQEGNTLQKSQKMPLDALFDQRSIAIIGASPKPGFPSRVPQFLLKFGYPGKVYPINPKYQELFGLKAYPNLAAVPDEVDLALIIVGAKHVMPLLEECAEKGVKTAVVFSSGFSETGEEGKALQEEMRRLCERTGLRVLGPNCLGYVDVSHKLVVTSASLMERLRDLDEVKDSSIAFITQSGALGSMTYGEAYRQGAGFRYFVSTGNEVDIEVSEVASYVIEDPAVNVVGLYLESVKNPEHLRVLAEKSARLDKPVAALKVGRSSVGKRAAASHTGSIAGSDQVYDAFFRQHGILRAKDMQELVDFLMLASCGRMVKGDRLGVITLSGGAGIMISDQCEDLGIQVPELSAADQDRIRPFIPPFGSAANPVDITAEVLGKPEILKPSLEALTKAENIDAVLVFFGLVDHMALRLIDDIHEVYQQTDKPIVVTWYAGSDEVMKKLSDYRIPAYRDPSRAVGAIRLLMEYQKRRQIQKQAGQAHAVAAGEPAGAGPAEAIREQLRQQIAAGKTHLNEYEAKQLFAAYGIPVGRSRLATSADEAVKAAEDIGYPVVMKVASADILHKTDAGGVMLNIRTPEEVRQAYERIVANARQYAPGARIDGVLVEEMLEADREVILGVIQDATFGPTLMFGLGGVFVEVLKDVSFRVCPLSPADAREMIREIKGIQILEGARGKKPADVDQLADILIRISRMATDLDDLIEEMEINPLLISADGQRLVAADGLIKLHAKK